MAEEVKMVEEVEMVEEVKMVEEEETKEEVMEEKTTEVSHQAVESAPTTADKQKSDETAEENVIKGDFVQEEVEKDIEKSSETPKEKAQSDVSDNSNSMKAEPKQGVLEVKVHEAKELENKAMLGKSDPYVYIEFEDSKFQSQTVNSNLAPKWGFITNLNISEDNVNNIEFSVFDDNYGKDQLLGSCSVPLREALALADKEEQWVPLEQCKSGMISVSFKFTENEEQISDQAG